MDESMAERKTGVLTRVFAVMQRCIADNCTRAKMKTPKDRYPFIPLSTEEALHQLLGAIDHLRKREDNKYYTKYSFLDAGCGFGNIMMMAAEVGFKPYGLEIDERLITHAKRVNYHWRNIRHKDILKYTRYGQFDVIYYYCPFCNGKLQQKFEERVEDQMKVGAILMPNLKVSNRIEKDKRFKLIQMKGRGLRFFKKVSK